MNRNAYYYRHKGLLKIYRSFFSLYLRKKYRYWAWGGWNLIDLKEFNRRLFYFCIKEDCDYFKRGIYLTWNLILYFFIFFYIMQIELIMWQYNPSLKAVCSAFALCLFLLHLVPHLSHCYISIVLSIYKGYAIHKICI